MNEALIFAMKRSGIGGTDLDQCSLVRSARNDCTQLPSVFCHKYIEDGILKTLLPKYTSMPKRGIYIIYPDRR
jgi:hypothetical protein